jgi:hypothetical protein
MKFLNPGFDHVEFVVRDFSLHDSIYERMGFELLGEHFNSNRGLRYKLWGQGQVRVLLTKPEANSLAAKKREETRFLDAHEEIKTVKIKRAALENPILSFVFIDLLLCPHIHFWTIQYHMKQQTCQAYFTHFALFLNNKLSMI